MTAPRFPWSMGDKRRGGPLLGPGGPPELFAWNPEEAEALPDTSTFTRASTAQVLTTTDGTTNWYQEAKSGELRLDGMRRINVNGGIRKDIDNWTIQATVGVTDLGDDEFEIDFDNLVGSGVLNQFVDFGDDKLANIRVEMRVPSVSGEIEIRDPGGGSYSVKRTLTTNWQVFSLTTAFTPLSVNPGIYIRRAVAGDVNIIQVRSPQLQQVQTSTSVVDSWIDRDVVYNAVVAGIRYFATDNGNSVDGSGVVTEATGTTITGGGYLPEPSSTDQILESTNFADAAWTKEGILAPTNNGRNSLGLIEHELDAGTGGATGHRIFATPSTALAGSGYFIVKQGTGRFVTVRRGGGDTDDYAAFDLQLGTITEEGAGIDDAFITDRTNGYYKIEVNTSDASALFALAISDTGTPGTAFPAFAASNETILVCHSQWENTNFSTSPILTAGSTVTRVSDIVTSTTTWPEEHSALCDVTVPNVASDNAMLAYSGANRFLLQNAPGRAVIFNSGIQATATASTEYQGERHKFAFSLKDDEGIVVDDEGNANTDPTGTVVVAGIPIRVGFQAGTGGEFRGRMHNVIVYDATQTQSELEDLVS